MDILSTLLSSAANGSLNKAAESRGLDSAGTAALLKQLVPALTSQVKKNASKESGLSSLTRALSSGNHQRYIDDDSALTSEDAVREGNGILGHILGSKDASRTLAAHAANQTGIDVSLVKKFLPVVAAAAMGAMSKDTNAGNSGIGGLLSKFIDSDGDGSVVDDLLSFGKKFL